MVYSVESKESLNFHIPKKGKDSITLIGGLNGSGKTTIFESIQVCFWSTCSDQFHQAITNLLKTKKIDFLQHQISGLN